MLATINDLTPKINDIQIVEHNNLVLVSCNEDASKIKKCINHADVAYTLFIKQGKKTFDVTGYTTGIGLDKKEIFKLSKKPNAIRFKSDFLLSCKNTDCMESISNAILENYEVNALDQIENTKFFFLLSKKPPESYDCFGDGDQNIFVNVCFISPFH